MYISNNTIERGSMSCTNYSNVALNSGNTSKNYVADFPLNTTQKPTNYILTLHKIHCEIADDSYDEDEDNPINGCSVDIPEIRSVNDSITKSVKIQVGNSDCYLEGIISAYCRLKDDGNYELHILIPIFYIDKSPVITFIQSSFSFETMDITLDGDVYIKELV